MITFRPGEQARPPVNEVKTYESVEAAPPGYKVIADATIRVQDYSKDGSYAMDLLREKALSVGASGVIVTRLDTEWEYVSGGPTKAKYADVDALFVVYEES